MGVTLAYQAIPPESSFYARLKHDRAFRILSIHLFDSGHLFNLFEDDPESFDESMENAFEGYPDVFCGTELETSLLIEDFCEAVRVARRDYPNIVDITGSLEKSFEEVSDKLTEELSRLKFEDIDEIVATLLYGDNFVGKNVLPDEETFQLVSRKAVKNGANILRQIEPEKLFPRGDNGAEGWYLINLRKWKECYLLADDNDAEILMNVL
jgi:(2Fe-2S) ferredoxin